MNLLSKIVGKDGEIHREEVVTRDQAMEGLGRLIDAEGFEKMWIFRRSPLDPVGKLNPFLYIEKSDQEVV